MKDFTEGVSNAFKMAVNFLFGVLVFVTLLIIGYGMTLLAIGGALLIVPLVALGKTVKVFSK